MPSPKGEMMESPLNNVPRVQRIDIWPDCSLQTCLHRESADCGICSDVTLTLLLSGLTLSA